tara:strand:- start:368 stop:580 length:213 start_codon:yes stop_codon:yes gene_type:complete
MKKISEILSKNIDLISYSMLGLVFWGSIFNAILLSFFPGFGGSLIISSLPYFVGLIFGILAKYKEWSWIN